jgi:hypothetical protein
MGIGAEMLFRRPDRVRAWAYAARGESVFFHGRLVSERVVISNIE